MSAERKSFPDSLTAFIVVFEDIAHHENTSLLNSEVCRLHEAVGECLTPSNQRKAINRRLCSLHQSNPRFFMCIHEWLASDPVTKIFIENGLKQQLKTLDNALLSIAQGETPSKALGMHKNGAPPLWKFTNAEDAAIVAQHLHTNGGHKKYIALELASEKFGIDKSNILKAKVAEASKDELAKQNEVICAKHGFNSTSQLPTSIKLMGG